MDWKNTDLVGVLPATTRKIECMLTPTKVALLHLFIDVEAHNPVYYQYMLRMAILSGVLPDYPDRCPHCGSTSRPAFHHLTRHLPTLGVYCCIRCHMSLHCQDGRQVKTDELDLPEFISKLIDFWKNGGIGILPDLPALPGITYV